MHSKILFGCETAHFSGIDCISKNVYDSVFRFFEPHRSSFPSRKHLLAKVNPDLHLTISKYGGNLGLKSKFIKSDNFQYYSIKLYAVDVY